MLRVFGLGLKVQSCWFRVFGLGFREGMLVLGLRFRI